MPIQLYFYLPKPNNGVVVLPTRRKLYPATTFTWATYPIFTACMVLLYYILLSSNIHMCLIFLALYCQCSKKEVRPSFKLFQVFCFAVFCFAVFCFAAQSVCLIVCCVYVCECAAGSISCLGLHGCLALRLHTQTGLKPSILEILTTA